MGLRTSQMNVHCRCEPRGGKVVLFENAFGPQERKGCKSFMYSSSPMEPNKMLEGVPPTVPKTPFYAITGTSILCDK